MEEAKDNVVNLDIRRVERINHIRVPLGTMSFSELGALADKCRVREDEARIDWMTVQDYMDRRFPGDDGGDAA